MGNNFNERRVKDLAFWKRMFSAHLVLLHAFTLNPTWLLLRWAPQWNSCGGCSASTKTHIKEALKETAGDKIMKLRAQRQQVFAGPEGGLLISAHDSLQNQMAFTHTLFVPAHCLDPQPGRRRRIKGIWISLTGAAHWSDQRCRTLTNASLQLFYNDILIWPRQPIIPFSATFFAWPCNCCTF